MGMKPPKRKFIGSFLAPSDEKEPQQLNHSQGVMAAQEF